jgi:hypothetical protein
VDLLLLQTLRAQGASRAFAHWTSVDAGAAPAAPAACPTTISGLDECRMGGSRDAGLVVGRRDAEVFRLAGRGVDLERLASLQAGRLVR